MQTFEITYAGTPEHRAVGIPRCARNDLYHFCPNGLKQNDLPITFCGSFCFG
jgi:hypothetical protein